MYAKRYQVFVSSTYVDLVNERQKVIQTIMEMDCMPAGMELFPALDQEQFDFIKTVIDDSDYYVIILGGRYGSLNSDGIGYTEAEYDYAISKGIKVVALIHQDPTNLPVSKYEKTDEARKKLDIFRDKLMKGRLVKQWTNASELPGLLSLSLGKTIKTYPAVGWIRGNQISNAEAVVKINSLSSENDKLRKEISQIKINQILDTMQKRVDGSEQITITIKYTVRSQSAFRSVSKIVTMTLDEIIDVFGLRIRTAKTEQRAKDLFEKELSEKFAITNGVLSTNIFDTIGIKLSSIDLVRISVANSTDGNSLVWWQLTALGLKHIETMRLGGPAKSSSAS